MKRFSKSGPRSPRLTLIHGAGHDLPQTPRPDPDTHGPDPDTHGPDPDLLGPDPDLLRSWVGRPRPGIVVRVDGSVALVREPTAATATEPIRASWGGQVLAAMSADPEAEPTAGDRVGLRFWPDGRVTVETVAPRGGVPNGPEVVLGEPASEPASRPGRPTVVAYSAVPDRSPISPER